MTTAGSLSSSLRRKVIIGAALLLGATILAPDRPPPGLGEHRSAGAQACSEDNGRIAFVRDFPRAGTHDIWSIAPSGKGLLRLTNSGNTWSPAWSPDGTQLLYSGKHSGETDFEIYRIDRDGSNRVNLTMNDQGDGTPAWSPDGQWIAFSSVPDDAPDDDFELYKMRANGTEVTRLTDNKVQDWTPSWSSNSSRIVYYSNEKLKVMNADGTGVKAITGRRPFASPDWGRGRIVAKADHIDEGGEEIWTMRPDGSRRKRLTRRPGADQAPAWAPNGKRIAYSKDWNLAVMRRDGSRSRTIHKGQGDVYAVDWGPRCPTVVS